jgi:predicted lipoprotein with Yx(FWY)xxD motif
MVKSLTFCAVAILVSGCGGGSGSGSGSAYTGGVLPSMPPATGSSNAPVGGGAPVPPSTASAPLSTSSLKGSPGFVNGNQHTVYVFDADLATPNFSTCTGGCASFWPPVTPPAGVTLSSPFASFVRADGTMQLSYNGRALYTLSTDVNPGDANGDGLNAFGGIWHIARPQAAATPAPQPVITPDPGIGGVGGGY